MTAQSPVPEPAPPAAASSPGLDISSLQFPEIEKLFLDGTISARQFQYSISRMPADKEAKPTAHPKFPAPVKLAPEQETKAVEVLRQTTPDPAQNPPPGPAIKPEQLPVVLTPDQVQPEDSIEKDFFGIEQKMDELLALKKRREKSEQEAILKPADPSAPQVRSKRERLDDLLRLFINGKIPQADYNAQRKAIIAEPD